jgi:hypothetical protein
MLSLLFLVCTGGPKDTGLGFDQPGIDDPDLALGGLSLYDDDPAIRLDIPAHGGVAIMKVAGYLGLESWPGAYPRP